MIKAGQTVETQGAHLWNPGERGKVCRWHHTWGERLDGYVPVKFARTYGGGNGIILVPVENLRAVA